MNLSFFHNVGMLLIVWFLSNQPVIVEFTDLHVEVLQ